MKRKKLALFGATLVGLISLGLIIQKPVTDIKAAEKELNSEVGGSLEQPTTELPFDLDFQSIEMSEPADNLSIEPRATGTLYESAAGIVAKGDEASLKQGVFADGWMLSPHSGPYTFNPYPGLALTSGWYTSESIWGSTRKYASQARYKVNTNNSITFGSRFNTGVYPTPPNQANLINEAMLSVKKPGISVVPNTSVNLSMGYKFTGLDLSFNGSYPVYMLAWYFDVNGNFISNSMVYPSASNVTVNSQWNTLKGSVRVPSNAYSMAVGIYPMTAGKPNEFYDLDVKDIKVTGEIPPPVAAKPITVKYVNQNNAEIAPTKTHTGNVGDAYTLTPENIDGYTWNGVYPDNWNGVMTNTPLTLTYKYNGNTVTNVYAQYLDVDTNESIKTQTTLPTGRVGNTYTQPTAPTIEGYEWVKTEGGSGTYTARAQYIKYYYKNTALTYNLETKGSPQNYYNTDQQPSATDRLKWVTSEIVSSRGEKTPVDATSVTITGRKNGGSTITTDKIDMSLTGTNTYLVTVKARFDGEEYTETNVEVPITINEVTYALTADSAGKQEFIQESEPDIELKDWVKNVRLKENEHPELEAFEPDNYTVTFKTPNALDTSAVGEKIYTLEVKTTYNGKTYTTTVDVPVEIVAGELSLNVPTVLGFEDALAQTSKKQVVSRKDPDWAIKVEDTRAASQRTDWDLNVRIVEDFRLNSSDNRKHSLSDILVYKENAASDSVFLSEASYPILKSPSALSDEVTKKWSAESGFLLEVSRLKSLQIKDGEYDATLEFQLLVGP